MTRMSYTIRGDADRQSVSELVRTLKDGMRVDIKMAKRSDPQNAKFWAMLGEVADQVVWHGEKLPAEDWKYLFLDAYKREIRLIPAIEGKGFVAIGRSSSDLTVAEMADVITLIEMFGANHGVKFKQDSNSSDARQDPTSRDRMDTPAARGPQNSPAAGVSNSGSLGSTVANDRAIAPADKDPDDPHAAGANRSEASLLSDDWRDVYIVALAGVRDKAASLLTRHAEAIQMIGGDPNESELAWMRKAWRLVQRRNEAKLKRGEYEVELEQLKSMPLSAAQDAA